MSMDKFRILVKTFQGLEGVLAKELETIGAEDIALKTRAVEFTGNKELLYSANYLLRTAIRVLKPIYAFTANNENSLYNGVKSINWLEYLDEKKTIAVDSVVSSSWFTHSKYVALKTKDAIVDQIREKRTLRPSINVIDPDVRINIHIVNDRVTVSLDSSGEPLFKRGYRTAGGEAPLNEVLAAGIIQLIGWDKKSAFIDPMCGSGTFLAEAGLFAYDIPPGFLRESFGFQKWKDYDPDIFEKIAKPNPLSESKGPRIHGSDISAESIRIASKNIRKTGLIQKVTLRVKPMDDIILPSGITHGVVVLNPPYGERLRSENIIDLYKSIGDTLKKKYAGYDVWILSSNREAVKNIGLHASKKITLFNGPFECKLLKYEIYSGSKKNN